MAFTTEQAMLLVEDNDPSVEEELSPQQFTTDQVLAMADDAPDAEADDGFFTKSYRSFISGLNSAEAMAARVPALAYSAAATPQNIVANLTGWNVGTQPPAWMLDNPITKHFEDGAKAYDYIGSKYAGETLSSLVGKKDFTGAADLVVQSAIQSAPITLGMLAGNLAGIPVGAVTAAGGALQGAQTYKDAREKNLGELESLTASVLNGAAETIFERAGTFGLAEWAGSVLKDFGKRTGSAVIKNALKVGFGTIVGEGNEEFFTQLTQDLTNKAYGVEDIPWNQFLPRAIQAGAIGTVSGAAMTLPFGASKALRAADPAQVDDARSQKIVAEMDKYMGKDTSPSTEGTGVSVTETPVGDTVINNAPPLVAGRETINQTPVENPIVAKQVPPEVPFSLKPDVAALQEGQKIEAAQEEAPPAAEIITGPQMEELTRNTISEFRIGAEDAKGLDMENLIVEGKPRKEIYDRAKYLRDIDMAAYEAKQREAADALEKIGRFYLDPKSGITEEMKAIPKQFLRGKYLEKGGARSSTFDEVAGRIKNDPEIHHGKLNPESSTSDVINFLAEFTETKKPMINSYLPDAKRQIVEESQGQLYERVQPGIKRAIRENTGQVRPAEDPTITESEALNAQMKIAEKASKEGFKAGKKVGIESVKSAKQIIERRRMAVRAIRDDLKLTDEQMRRVSRKDIRLMDNYEFKKFLDDLELKAAELADTRDAKLAVMSTLYEKEFKKSENLRKFMDLPPITDMTPEQLNDFNSALELYQHHDEFLNVRALETLGKGELAGAKTFREVLEIYADKTGQDVSEVVPVEVGSFWKMLHDTSLARQDPFMQVLVDTNNVAFLKAAQNLHDLEKNLDPLIEKARASRDRSLLDRAIPQDDLIVKYLEPNGEDKTSITAQMTPEELDAANYVRQWLSNAKDYLVERGVLERFIAEYFPHTKKGFLESAKDDGVVSAFKELLRNSEDNKSVMQVLDLKTNEVLPHEQHFKYAMERSGVLNPSKNVARAIKIYARAFYTKQAIDEINPAMMTYAMALSPQVKMADGKILRDARLTGFVKEFLNTKQGRLNDLGGFVTQGGKMDRALNASRAYVTVMDLGGNIVSSIANQIGDPLADTANIGFKKMAVGIKRFNTAKGKAIIEANRDFVGKSPWKELADTANDIGETVHKALFVALGASSNRANKIFLLGSMTDAEWQSGKISVERKAELMREMGAYRATQGSRSIIGSTSAAKIVTLYQSWAIPMANTTVHNAKTIIGQIGSGDFDEMLRSKEFQQAVRQFGISALALLLTHQLYDKYKNDKSTMGKAITRFIKEGLSLLTGLDPRNFTKPRMLGFIGAVAELSVLPLITLYDSATGTPSDVKKDIHRILVDAKKVFVPKAISQFIPKEESSTGVSNKLSLGGRGRLGNKLSLE